MILREYIRRVLEEGAQERYMQMFGFLDSVPDWVKHMFKKDNFSWHNPNKIVEWARRRLKKNDAIVWFLRWYRAWMLHRMIYFHSTFNKLLPFRDEFTFDGTVLAGATYEEAQTAFSMIDRLLKREGAKLSPEDPEEVLAYIAMNNPLQTTLEHFMSMDIPAINDYDWGRKHPDQVLGDFETIEEEWRKRFDGLIAARSDDQVVMKFEDGYAWLFLPRWKCDIESKAMGHCGNAGGVSGDRILSLRSRAETREGDPAWKPRLTFILDKDNMLGEMKASHNNKPDPKYHPYIMALLAKKSIMAEDTDANEEYARDIAIAGLKGGGYMPQNNFAIEDLSEEDRESLMAEAPYLGPIETHLKAVGPRDSKLGKRVAALLENFLRYSDDQILWNDDLKALVDANGFWADRRPWMNALSNTGGTEMHVHPRTDTWQQVTAIARVLDYAYEDRQENPGVRPRRRPLYADAAGIPWDEPVTLEEVQTMFDEFHPSYQEQVIRAMQDVMIRPMTDERKVVRAIWEDKRGPLHESIRLAVREGKGLDAWDEVNRTFREWLISAGVWYDGDLFHRVYDVEQAVRGLWESQRRATPGERVKIVRDHLKPPTPEPFTRRFEGSLDNPTAIQHAMRSLNEVDFEMAREDKKERERAMPEDDPRRFSAFAEEMGLGDEDE